MRNPLSRVGSALFLELATCGGGRMGARIPTKKDIERAIRRYLAGDRPWPARRYDWYVVHESTRIPLKYLYALAFNESPSKWSTNQIKTAVNGLSLDIRKFESDIRPAKIEAGHVKKLPALRDWLINVARTKGSVAYSDVMYAFDIDRFSLHRAMEYLGREARSHGEPIITALIVEKHSGVCSVGLRKEFGVEDDANERARLYEYWGDTSAPKVIEPASADVLAKALRFASVAARPEQAAFRRKVFVAYGGKCAITGCSVVTALDAAHLRGRDWRLGHNDAEDGILLRKDVHALYDAGLLDLDERWVVSVVQDVSAHYGQFAGLRAKT